MMTAVFNQGFRPRIFEERHLGWNKYGGWRLARKTSGKHAATACAVPRNWNHKAHGCNTAADDEGAALRCPCVSATGMRMKAQRTGARLNSRSASHHLILDRAHSVAA
jgi:hypothetical protein